MKQFNIAEAKAHFSEMVQQAICGEEIVIARDNKPLLKLVPIAPSSGKRLPGSAYGSVSYVAPDFDATPDDFAAYV